MGKYIISKFEYSDKQFLFRGFTDNKRFYQIGFDDMTKKTPKLGDIYVGRVKDIVKNINAAFIEFEKNEVGYYSLLENHAPVYLNKKNTDKLCEGDTILVQVKKEAVKTKALTLTSDISLAGKYIVLNLNKSGVGISSKIKDTEFKANITKELEAIINTSGLNTGVVVRTNAVNVELEDIKNELISLIKRYSNIVETAKTRTIYTKVYSEDKEYLKMLKGVYEGEIDEIITDDINVYEDILNNFSEDINKKYKVKFYEDELLPLYKLYSIESLIKDVLSKKVWLKSGGYLVIEHTEAMTVIDVNTGKCIKGKDIEKTSYNINIEATEEIVYQLKVRNISGIIIIDFINMSSEEKKSDLINYLKKLISKDRIKTDFIEMTKLELVELTRKKVEKPIFEQL